MRVALCVNNTLTDTGVLLLLSAYKICVMDPLIKRVIISKSGSSGNGFEEIPSGPVKAEDLLSVETEIFPWSENSACLTRQRLHIGYSFNGLSLLA